MMLMTLAAASPESHVLPHKLIDWGKNINFGADVIPILNIALRKEFLFTNHLLMTLVSAALCLAIFPMLATRYAAHRGNPQAPRGVMNLLEALLEFVRKGVAEPVLKERTDRFMPFLWTMFFFILFCNLLGMVPLDSIIALFTGGRVQHMGGTATGNLAVTGGLAICSFLMIHVSGTVEVFKGLVAGTYGHHGHGDEHADDEHGGQGHADHSHHSESHASAHGHAHGHAHAGGMTPAAAALLAFPLYIWNFAPHVFKPAADAGPIVKFIMTIADVGMWAFLLILELLGAIIKPFALMIRLFANMVAGHIVLASILALIPAITGVAALSIGLAAAVGCTLLSCLELFVAFLQAYIFTFLTTLFLGMSVAPEH